MKRVKTCSVVVLAAFAGLLLQASLVRAQAVPKSLRGHIITNSKPIKIPNSMRGFVKKLRKQDRKAFSKTADGQWEIHFVAFFKRPLPVEQLGIVVLDAKNEPVAVANVAGTKGQKTLSTHIIVDTTETVKKKHTLKVYFARGDKPVDLAKKQIVLK